MQHAACNTSSGGRLITISGLGSVRPISHTEKEGMRQPTWTATVWHALFSRTHPSTCDAVALPRRVGYPDAMDCHAVWDARYDRWHGYWRLCREFVQHEMRDHSMDLVDHGAPCAPYCNIWY